MGRSRRGSNSTSSHGAKFRQLPHGFWYESGTEGRVEGSGLRVAENMMQPMLLQPDDDRGLSSPETLRCIYQGSGFKVKALLRVFGYLTQHKKLGFTLTACRNERVSGHQLSLVGDTKRESLCNEHEPLFQLFLGIQASLRTEHAACNMLASSCCCVRAVPCHFSTRSARTSRTSSDLLHIWYVS